MDRRSFLTTVLQALSGIALAAASFFTLKTNRFVTPLSKDEKKLHNLFAQSTPPPPGGGSHETCPKDFISNGCSTGDSLICADYTGPCKKEVICNSSSGDYGNVPCSNSSAYTPACPDHEACPDTGTGIHPNYCPNH